MSARTFRYSAVPVMALTTIVLSGCIGVGDRVKNVPPLQLEGRLVDHLGEPVANAKLHVRRYLRSEVDAKNAPRYLQEHPNAPHQSEATVTTLADGSFKVDLERGQVWQAIAIVGIIPIPPLPPRIPKHCVRIDVVEDGNGTFIIAGGSRGGRVYRRIAASDEAAEYVALDNEQTGLGIRRSKELEEIVVTLIVETPADATRLLP